MISLKMLKKTLSKRLSEINQISRKKAELFIKDHGVLLNGVTEKRPYISVLNSDDIQIQKQISGISRTQPQSRGRNRNLKRTEGTGLEAN